MIDTGILGTAAAKLLSLTPPKPACLVLVVTNCFLYSCFL